MEQQQQYLTPSILSSGKFSRFTSPMFEKGCWRIGTISDGSCFFHAIVTSLSKSYRDTEEISLIDFYNNFGAYF